MRTAPTSPRSRRSPRSSPPRSAAVSPVTLNLRKRGGRVLASGSAPVGDYMELEAFRGSPLRYHALFMLNRFNRYSIALPSALGTSGLRVRVYQFWAGPRQRRPAHHLSSPPFSRPAPPLVAKPASSRSISGRSVDLRSPIRRSGGVHRLNADRDDWTIVGPRLIPHYRRPKRKNIQQSENTDLHQGRGGAWCPATWILKRATSVYGPAGR